MDLDDILNKNNIDNLYLVKVGELWYASYSLLDSKDSKEWEVSAYTAEEAIKILMQTVC